MGIGGKNPQGLINVMVPPILFRTAVFLDRDGVLNATCVRAGVPHPPQTPEEVEILPGVRSALTELAAGGFLLIGITNQPDVARGMQTREMVERINGTLRAALPLQAVYTCYHDNADCCDCRKPLPGLIHRAAADYTIDVAASFMVGDRWSDVAAGAAAGCKTFLVDRPYSQSERCTPDYRVADLLEAARIILSLQRGRRPNPPPSPQPGE